MNEHWVVIYVNDGAKTFTATARKMSARLPEVDTWASKNGFNRMVVARHISKPQANLIKKQEIAKYEGLGYTYVCRPKL